MARFWIQKSGMLEQYTDLAMLKDFNALAS
jgi:hypothetical protein